MAGLGFSYQGTCIVAPIQIPAPPQVSAPVELFYAHTRCVAQSRVDCICVRSYLRLCKTISPFIDHPCREHWRKVSHASKNPRAVSINHRTPGSGMVTYPITLLPELSDTVLKLFHQAAEGRVTSTNFASGYSSMSSGMKSMAVTSAAPTNPEKASSSASSSWVRLPARRYWYIWFHFLQ